MAVPLSQLHKLPSGGDAAVSKKRKVPLYGNIVETYHIGGTTIHICDDCIVKTPEEVDAILTRFLTIGAKMIREARERERAKEAQKEEPVCPNL